MLLAANGRRFIFGVCIILSTILYGMVLAATPKECASRLFLEFCSKASRETGKDRMPFELLDLSFCLDFFWLDAQIVVRKAVRTSTNFKPSLLPTRLIARA